MKRSGGSLQPWRRLGRTTLVQDRWCTLHADRYQRADERVVEPYYILDDPDWVHVVAVADDGRVILVRQFRPGAGAFCLELPGGVAERGEDPLATAQRELREETGWSARHWQALHRFRPNPGRQTNWFHVFLATGAFCEGPPRPDDNEEMELRLLTPAEVLREIETGEFTQGLHIAAFLLARSRLNAGASPA